MVEAGGIEPPSRDTPAQASTCVDRSLISASVAPTIRIRRYPTRLFSRSGGVEYPVDASLLCCVAGPRRRGTIDVATLFRQPGLRPCWHVKFFSGVVNEAIRPSARHPRRDSIRSIPIAPIRCWLPCYRSQAASAQGDAEKLPGKSPHASGARRRTPWLSLAR